MTKGTKIFRIIISVLLALTMLISVFFAAAMCLHIVRDIMGEPYNISVAGVEVTRDNCDDILGDGSVYYDAVNNILVLDNAEIKYDYSVIYSRVDLMINLVGENKFIMSGDYVPVIHASNYLLSKDLTIFGDGSLSIEFEGTSGDVTGIYAKDLKIESEVSLELPDCTNIANGIYSDGSMVLTNGASVTVKGGAGKFCTAVKTRNNLDIEYDSSLNVSIAPGSADLCRGLTVGGSLVVWDGAGLSVSVDDEAVKTSECISVSGLLRVKDGASLSAASKKAYAVACYGSIELNEGASISASCEAETTDLLCYGALVNYGGTVNAEAEALGGAYDRSEN